MRLIDADELKDTLLRYNYTTAHNQIFRYIDEQPTAYDVDKVVEKLEERKQEYLDGFGLHKNNELYGVACGLGDAVEIVKHGGVSGDMCEWKSVRNGEFIQNPHTRRLYSNEPSMKNVYCNTCGKKIKTGEPE